MTVTDIQEALENAQYLRKYYEELGTQQRYEAEVAKHKAIIAKAESEIAWLTDRFVNNAEHLKATDSRITELRNKLNIVMNQGKVAQLLKLMKEIADAEAHCGV